MSEKKHIFNDIVFVRLGLIVLLVFFHAFAIFGGAWHRKFTPPNVEFYYWLDWLSYSFMLESFVFISGFLFGNQEKRNGGMLLGKLILKKAKRLLLPSLIFSVLYFFCFQYAGDLGWKHIYDWMIGTAHMWFLPMLFLCFVVVGILREQIVEYFRLVVVISIVLSLFSFISLPFRIDKTLDYFTFFVIGYSVGLKNNNVFDYSHKRVKSIGAFFIASFVGFTLLNRHLMEIKGAYPAMTRCFFYVIMNTGKLIYSSLGVMLVYMLMNRIKQQGNFVIHGYWMEISECCFGVYLIQQFVLVFLYDYTSLPTIINYVWLPWLCFLITLIASVILSWLFRQTKLGRVLI